MSTFTENLKACRKEYGITQKQLAIEIKISERAYQHYEIGTREPNLATLIALADFFGVSLDYLVGRTDNPEVNK